MLRVKEESLLVFLVSFLWFFISLTGVIGSGDHPWCYKDDKCAPSNWGGICKTGHAQSPIDFKQSTVSHSRHLRKIRINQAYLQGYSEFYVKNNGHTIQVQLREDLTSSLRIDSDGFRGAKYQLSQLHFHWGSEDAVGSEHTINGTSFPMELHLVHFSDKYTNLLEAVTDQNPRALAVFGIFFEISPEDNPAITPIVEALSTVVTYLPDPTLFKPSIPLNYSSFFPSVMDVYRYEGSLTTPSCGQKVVWTVFKNPVSISEKQLEAFRVIKDTFGHTLVDNYRPTQPIGRRKIYENTIIIQELPEEVVEKITSKEDEEQPSDKSKETGNDILENTKYTTHDEHVPDTQHRNGTKTTETGNNKPAEAGTNKTTGAGTKKQKSGASTYRIKDGFLLILVAFTRVVLSVLN